MFVIYYFGINLNYVVENKNHCKHMNVIQQDYEWLKNN